MPANVPDGVAAAARAAFSARDRDAVLAELVTDSADDDAGERSAERTLVFAGGGLLVTLRVRDEPGAGVLSAELEVQPPLSGDPAVDVRDRPEPEIDDVEPGRWSLNHLTPGPLRLVFDAGDRRVQTEWMRC